MSSCIIEKNGEDLLYAFILSEQNRGAAKLSDVQFLLCQFFQTGYKPDAKHLSEVLKNTQLNKDSVVYCCSDGDVFIRWQGQAGFVKEKIIESIYGEYREIITPVMDKDDFFVSYNIFDAHDKIKVECLKKQRKTTKQAQKLQEYFRDPSLKGSLKKVIHLVSSQRAFRKEPYILIVEDQIFSQKILLSILKDYNCIVARTCAEALLIYMEKCPDIVLLDLDLPDMSGHNFARLLAAIDDAAYVVVVSANGYQDDIAKAKSNNVQGYITKPYNKQAILEVIDKYKKLKKKRTS